MAGHSKWANIKHKKGAADAKRAKVFTKLAKEITVAAKLGGEDEDSNPRLRRAVAAARAVSMPKDNIQRAIKKGAGGSDGANFEEITYEGYGPGGVAILVDCLTDNTNRSLHEIRYIFNKGNGNLGEIGSVNYMFDTKGVITFDKAKIDSEKTQEVAIDLGADDIEEDEDYLTIYTAFEDFDRIRDELEKQGFAFSRAEVSKIPQTTVPIEGEDAEKVIQLVQTLEDNDDVQNVHANFDISDSEFERISNL
tara:strand:+ start:12932 stop:13684 length:753 start_codon:yes stop_codon:yes gene_type:complete